MWGELRLVTCPFQGERADQPTRRPHARARKVLAERTQSFRVTLRQFALTKVRSASRRSGSAYPLWAQAEAETT